MDPLQLIANARQRRLESGLMVGVKGCEGFAAGEEFFYPAVNEKERDAFIARCIASGETVRILRAS